MTAGGGYQRLFLALPLTGEQRGEIVERIEPLRRMREAVRWVAPENLHVTLRFLGDTSPDVRAQVEERLVTAFREAGPFAWRLGGPGAFPNLRSARVLWIGASEGEGEIARLAGVVERSLEGLGFPGEKRFHAHVTVGRTKGRLSERFRSRFETIAPEALRAEATAVDLMKSTLTPKGAIYEKLRAFPMSGGREETE